MAIKNDGARVQAAPAQPAAVRAAHPGTQPVRNRRRPLLVGLGIALAALGGLAAAWLATAGTGTMAAVGVAHEIRAGQTIQREDLISVQVPADTQLNALPVDRAREVIGRKSLVRLLPGSLLNPAATTDKIVPGPGQALVGISVGSAQAPATPLDAGTPVRIVDAPTTTTGDQLGSAQSSTPQTVDAVVVDVSPDTDASRLVVDVTVAAADAARVAAWGSAGRASIVVLPAGQP